MNTPHATSGPVFVVPCGTEKLAEAAPARDLYTAAHFAKTLRTAERMAEADGGRVFILSAMYGLVDPDEVLAPYEQRMDRRGAISVHELELQLADKGLGDAEFYSLLPRSYREALVAALAAFCNGVCDLYEAAPAGAQGGIGFQRHVTTAVEGSYAA